VFKKLSAFVLLLLHYFHARRDHQIAFMAYQNKMLRDRLDSERIIPKPDERKELIALAAKFDHQVDGLIQVVTPETYRGWLRDKAKGKEPRKVGRKPSEGELVDLVLEMRKNPGWGYERICGELKKLGIITNHMTVKAILLRHSKEPNPDGSSTRKKPIIPWSQWLEMHMDSLLACDFVQKTVWTLRGPRVAFILMFIHLGSRRVFVSPSTYNPDNPWLEQQVRNVHMWCADEGIVPKYLIRDNDGIFRGTFDAHMERMGVEIKRTAIEAPNMNAYAESWLSSFQRECLDFFVCVSLRQLDRICSCYANFHNTVRPHQGRGIGNRVLDRNFKPQAIGRVESQTWLGGLLRHYYRVAG